MATATRTIRAPRGTALTCKGWPQEAALRMLMNNLDPDVAERPDDLVVYGGTGRAARRWDAFDRILRPFRAPARSRRLRRHRPRRAQLGRVRSDRRPFADARERRDAARAERQAGRSLP